MPPGDHHKPTLYDGGACPLDAREGSTYRGPPGGRRGALGRCGPLRQGKATDAWSGRVRHQAGGRQGLVQRLGQEGQTVLVQAGLSRAVVADLRTDHAGETGAVWMYRGVLCLARDPALRAFAQRHRVTEQAHLRRIEAWLPPADRSRLLPLWRLAGWLTGALPALLGPPAVYATIEAVERFVDLHYARQISQLQAQPGLIVLRQVLLECQADERAHRDEASSARGVRRAGWLQRGWCQLVHLGSQAAVAVCRHV